MSVSLHKCVSLTDARMNSLVTSMPEPEAVDYSSEYRKADAEEAFGMLLRWLCSTKKLRNGGWKTVAARAFAMAIAVNPELIGGATAADIERITRGAISRRRLSKLVKQFQAQFGFRRELVLERRDR